MILGIKESDTGLAPPSQRDLIADKQMMSEEQPLQVNMIDVLCILWEPLHHQYHIPILQSLVHYYRSNHH